MPISLNNISEATVIFGGLTLGLLFLIWVVYKLNTNHGHDWIDVLNKNTDAFIKNAEAISDLSSTVKSTHKELNHSIKDLRDEIRSKK